MTVMTRSFVAATCFFLLCAGQLSALPAFPGAEGFGSGTPGGRGGAVLKVTTLEDGDEPGTLRWALTRPYPRIVVFEVGGTIFLDEKLYVGEEHAHLTIAGQTAPGGGICIANAPFGFWNTHDIIMRHVRIRAGDSGPSEAPDTLAINACQDVVIDHCSVSWGVDECLSITSHPPEAHGQLRGVTIQWSMIYEGLQESTHPKGAHSKGLMVAYGPASVSLHHNVIAHCYDRNPYLPTEGEVPYTMDVVNNVVYNWGAYAGVGYEKTNDNGRINWVGNRYIPGPDSREVPSLRMGVRAKVYASGNLGAVRTSEEMGQFAAVQWTGEIDDTSALKANEPFDAPAVTTWDCEEATALVLQHAGATLPARDSADARVVSDVRERSGTIIDHPSDVGGWPDLAPGEPPLDSDDDGMPDQWERERGLDPDDPADSRLDRNGDGYTNVEEYINELCPALSASARE
jgi:hypothetical protein